MRPPIRIDVACSVVFACLLLLGMPLSGAKRRNRLRCRLGLVVLQDSRGPKERWGALWRHLANTIERSMRGGK